MMKLEKQLAALTDIALRWGAMCMLLNGKEVPDSVLRFPEVRQLDDIMRPRRTPKNQKEGGDDN